MKFYIKIKHIRRVIIYQFRKGLVRRITHYLLKGHILKRIRILHYIGKYQIKKLQLGSWKHKKVGWLNIDIIAGDIYLNATKKFGIPSNTFDYIFAEQFLEHLTLEQGEFCIKECFRILKEGGKIRISVPDLKTLINLYQNKENDNDTLSKVLERHRRAHNPTLTTCCHYINDMFRLWGHKFIYDEETLMFLLRHNGFKDIERKEFGASNDRCLSNLERHASEDWMKGDFFLILEGTKLEK